MTTDAALGVRFAGDPLPLLRPGEGPEVDVRHAAAAEIDARWADAEAPRLLFINYLKDGRPFLTVEHDPALGYRVRAHEHGMHLIAADGSTLLAAPPEDPGGLGFRLLASQVYPLVAALHGREILHAGAVQIGGRLIGVAARSGTGKSSTIAQLLARGGSFFADDALALAGAVAHPGPRLLNVAFDQLEQLPHDVLGQRLGQSDKAHYAPPGDPAAAQLDALFFLERDPDGGGDPLIEPVPDAGRLLANASLPYLDTPQRLRNQLEVLGALAAIPLLRLQVGEGESAARVAERVMGWADGTPA